MPRTTPLVASIATLVLVLAACSAGAVPSASEPAQPSPSTDTPMASGDHMEFAWGEPADASAADRVVEIQMLDALTFEPASIDVKVGETVTFKVVNVGKIEHDFTLGDEEMQAEHEAEMASGMSGMGHDEPNVMTLGPGASGEMTWHFTESMSLLYGCHVPGHYDAGMVGTMTVAGG